MHLNVYFNCANIAFKMFIIRLSFLLCILLTPYLSFGNDTSIYGLGSPEVPLLEDHTEGILSGDLPQLVEYEIFDNTVEYDYPIHIDPISEQYLRYYTGPARNTFQMWLDRSNKYIHVVKDVLYQEGLPQDFVALPFAESGYSTEAVSWVGATGIWQFMPNTGLYYGLKRDFWQDERKDFEASTRAAAKYLKSSYERFNDWHLATASYNAGGGRVNGAIRNSGTRDYYAIINGN